MKKLLLLIAITALSINAHAQWVPVANPAPVCGVLDIVAADGTNVIGLSFCNTGTDIYLSSDEGNTWNSIGGSLPFFQYSYASLIDGSNIFIGASDSAAGLGLFLSNDYGLSWTIANMGFPLSNWISSLQISDTNIFAGVAGHGVYLSTDNGTSWISASTGLSSADQFYDFAVSGSKIYLGTDVRVFKTNNNGVNWTAVSNIGLPAGELFYRMGSIGSHILTAIYGEELYLTTNNGASWNLVYTANTFISDIITCGSKVCVSADNCVLMSLDSGLTWTNIGSFNNQLTDLAASSTYLFASEIGCAGNSQAWKIPLSQLTGIEENQTQNSFSISPNPFSTQTTINFTVEQKNAEIKIKNIMGREINCINFTGRQLTLEKGKLSNGIYFVQITDEKKNFVSKKIIIQ